MPIGTFELTLQSTSSENQFRVVAEWSQPWMLTVRREREILIEESDKHPALYDAVDAQSYGTVLGRLIFDGGIRDLFAQARVANPELRVLLAVEARRLQALRWERLCAPFEDERWQLLCLQQRAPFSLY